MVSVLIYVFLATIWFVRFIREEKSWDSFGAWSSFWGAFFQFCGSLFAFVGLLAVLYAIKQLRLSAWANAQEIFMKKDFVGARTIVLNHWEDQPPYSFPSKKKDENAALLVCRRMDALCRLVDKRFISKNELFKVWGKPLAKSYIIIVERCKVFDKEINTCKDHRDKWEPFCRVGKEAADLNYPQRSKQTK